MSQALLSPLIQNRSNAERYVHWPGLQATSTSIQDTKNIGLLFETRFLTSPFVSFRAGYNPLKNLAKFMICSRASGDMLR